VPADGGQRLHERHGQIGELCEYAAIKADSSQRPAGVQPAKELQLYRLVQRQLHKLRVRPRVHSQALALQLVVGWSAGFIGQLQPLQRRRLRCDAQPGAEAVWVVDLKVSEFRQRADGQVDGSEENQEPQNASCGRYCGAHRCLLRCPVVGKAVVT
jgi:hypothetical protein